MKNEYKTWNKKRSNRLIDYNYSIDCPVHLTICSQDKKAHFNSEPEGEIITNELIRTEKELDFYILCYCLMPDHLHIVLSPGQSGIAVSKFLNLFKGRTTTVFRKLFRCNKIWQRSAYDHVIRAEEDLMTIVEYILNNPVRKGLVNKAEVYAYSKLFDNQISKYI